MKSIIIAAVLAASLVQAAPQQPIKPKKIQTIIALPDCDVSKLIDLLDLWYGAADTVPLFDPMVEYCAPRTCELREKAKTYTRDAALSQQIDLMRLACRQVYPSAKLGGY